MGTVWYIAREDTKELFDIGKPGFWFADANGLSDYVPCPSISADRGAITALVGKAYAFDAAQMQSVIDRIVAFIGPGAAVVDEYSLDLDPDRAEDDEAYEWRGATYRVVDCVYNKDGR